MFNLDRTTFQHIIAGEQEDFTRQSSIDTSALDDPFVDSNVLYQVLSNSSALQDLIKTSWYTQNEYAPDNIKYEHYKRYFQDVTANIIKVNSTHSLKDALQLIVDTHQLMGPTFAGALLVHGESIINPFHPLVALSLLDTDPAIHYKVIVYAYSDRPNLDRIYSTHLASRSAMHKNINDLIRTFTSRNKHRNVEVVNTDVSSPTNITQSYRIEKQPGEDLEREYYITAHQVMTKGIVAPSYGTSIIRMGNTESTDTDGVSCTPFRSANISSVNRQKDQVPQYNSVCTGGLSNSTFTGLRSLTHSNHSSPYTDFTLEQGALAYADMCIAKSIEIYSLSKFITLKELPNDWKQLSQIRIDDSTGETY